MSVFFENEFKNESENEIKNESENRCIMLPEEVKGKGYFALTGSKLKAYVEKWLDGIDEERDFVESWCRKSCSPVSCITSRQPNKQGKNKNSVS